MAPVPEAISLINCVGYTDIDYKPYILYVPKHRPTFVPCRCIILHRYLQHLILNNITI